MRSAGGVALSLNKNENQPLTTGPQNLVLNFIGRIIG